MRGGLEIGYPWPQVHKRLSTRSTLLAIRTEKPNFKIYSPWRYAATTFRGAYVRDAQPGKAHIGITTVQCAAGC